MNERDRGEIAGEIDAKWRVITVVKFTKGCRICVRVHVSSVVVVQGV